MKSLTLPVRTFHRFDCRKVDVISYPTFHAVCKRRGFYKFPPYLEFPAVYTETAVIDRLPFIRKTLDAAPLGRKFPVGIGTHVCSFLKPLIRWNDSILKTIQNKN